MPEPVTPCSRKPSPDGRSPARASRSGASAARWAPVSVGATAAAVPSGRDRAPRANAGLEPDQSPSLQPPQALACRARPPPSHRALAAPRAARAGARSGGQASRAAHRVRPASARRPANAWRDALRGAGREHQAERAGGRRAVLASHPAPRAPPSRRGSEAASTCIGLGEPVGLELGDVGELDDHAERLADRRTARGAPSRPRPADRLGSR